MIANPQCTTDEWLVLLAFYQKHKAKIPSKTSPHIKELSRDLKSLRASLAGLPKNFRNPQGVAMQVAQFAGLDSGHAWKGTRPSQGAREAWELWGSEPRKLQAEIRKIRRGKPKSRILSLGAGVQSSTLALLAARGKVRDENNKIIWPDYAIFADTGWEPENVYKHLKWLEREIQNKNKTKYRYPFKLIKTSTQDRHKHANGKSKAKMNGNGSWKIQDHLLKGKNSTGQDFITVPVYIRNKDGKSAIARRQCTREYKLEPIRRALRYEVLGLKFGERVPAGWWVDQWIGISEDEMFRMKESRDWWCKNRWPLVDMRIKREDCIRWFKKQYPKRHLPRSACIGCPMHTDKEWLEMSQDDPVSWKEAVAMDKSIRRTTRKGRFDGDLYLHRSMTPLDKIDFTKTKHEKQVSLSDECEGMCGM